MSANTTTAGKTTSTPAADRDALWLGQFVYLDGGTFVHICGSKDAAYKALADREELTAAEGQTVAELIDDLFGESDLVSYNVLPVDSVNLDADGGDLYLAQLIRWDGGTFVHICGSKNEAYRVLADQEDLTIEAGQTAEQVVSDELEDSGDVDFFVVPVDSGHVTHLPS